MGELYIAEEAACWERKFMLFKVYLRQSIGMSSGWPLYSLTVPVGFGRKGGNSILQQFIILNL